MRPYCARSCIAAAALAAAACGGPPAPPSPVPRGISALERCPPPLLAPAGRDPTRRVRFENRTADTLSVFMDRCFQHTRVADVPPGATRLVRLPARLVAFPEGFRFHAFNPTTPEFVGTFVAPVTDEPVMDVLLSPGTVTPDSALAPVLSVDGGGRGERVGAFAVSETGGATGFAAVWARGSLAILTWACGEDGGRHLTLSLDGKLPGTRAGVRMRLDKGAFEDVGSWRVAEGVSDALVAPADVVEPITRKALGAATMHLVFTDEDGRRGVHSFPLADLERALAGRACFAPWTRESGG